MPGSSKESARSPLATGRESASFHIQGAKVSSLLPPSFSPSPDLMTIQRVPDRVLKDALHSPSTKHENPARLSPFFSLKAWPALGLQPQTCHSLFTSFCWICLYFILLSSVGTLLSPSSLHPCPSPPPTPSSLQFPVHTKKATDQSGNFFTVPINPAPTPASSHSLPFKNGSKSQQQLKRTWDPGTELLMPWLEVATGIPES